MKHQLNCTNRNYEIDMVLGKLADAYNAQTSKDLELTQLRQEIKFKDNIISDLQKEMVLVLNERSKMLRDMHLLQKDCFLKGGNIAERLAKLEHEVSWLLCSK